MEDFFRDLFAAAVKKNKSLLSDYEDDDLNYFFNEPKVDPKQHLVDMASYVLSNLENPEKAGEHCKRNGFTSKNIEKLQNYLKKSKTELQELKKNEQIGEEGRYLGSSWTVRQIFFSKKDEFKNQKKYGTVNIDVGKSGGGREKLILNCSKEAAGKIREKLAQCDKEIRGLFGKETAE